MSLKNTVLPFIRWFPMPVSNLKADFIAGLTVALVLIPQSMAYAQLAGLPAYYGLYAAFLPVIVAALWGSSKQLGTGPVAVVSLLTASSLSQFAGIGTEKFIALAIILALMVGITQLILGVFKLGVIVNFLSHPVIVGFTNAAAIIIGLSQINKIFGVEKERSEHFINDIIGVFEHVSAGETHLLTFAFGAGAILLMILLKKFVPKFPGVLIAVIGAIIISWAIDFVGKGGAVVGEIPAGLPPFGMPSFSSVKPSMIADLVTSAIVISLVGFMEAISIAKAMAARTKDRIDPNQELIGQGLANIIGSFSQSYPTSGSFSRSAVNLNAGAKTGMSSVFTASLVLITLLWLTKYLFHLPEAVLAAVIMMAVIGLVNFKAVGHALKASIHDGAASIITFFATLAFAPHLDKGIIVGAGLALILYLLRTMKPRVALLGRYEDGTMRDISVHRNLPQDDRIIVIRFDGSLYFANVSFFEDAVLKAVSKRKDCKYILVVGDGINELDASGEECISGVVESLKDNNITLVFSGLKRQVLKVMNSTHLYAKIGAENIHPNVNMAINHIYSRLNASLEDKDYCPLQPQAVVAPTIVEAG